MENEGPSRLISLHVPEELLRKDLETFKQKTMDLGASMAKIIPADWVAIDERVRLKCSIPLCPHYGKSLYCPPNGPDLEMVRKALNRYHWAILFALDVIPPEDFSNRSIQREKGKRWAKKCYEIVGRLETLALGSGYYLAMGFGQAGCKLALCEQEGCLILDGGQCPFPLKARPSMEGAGMDVYGLVRKVGWDIYPIYRSVNPKVVYRALSVGIVFIQ
jgi:predicted metal-binding protein